MIVEPVRMITEHDIAAIANGAAFLATGGGGDPMISRLACEQILRQQGPVPLLAVESLPADAWIVAIGGSGAPSIMLEKMPNGGEGVWALRKLEAHLGRKADALVAFEVGGSNSLLPIMTAALCGLPVVDADGMGRALPTMDMTTFAIYGVRGTPMAIVNEFGDSAVIETRDTATAEAFIRQLGLAMGGQCTSAEHSMSGAELQRTAIRGSIGVALEIGKLLSEQQGAPGGFHARLVDLLADSAYGEVRYLFEGKVVENRRGLEDGFDIGTISVAAFQGSQTLRLVVKNEYVLADIEGVPLALVPDLICVIDNDSCQPVTAERLRFGQRISIIAIGAPALLRSEKALMAVGPRCFGFDQDFVALEALPQPTQPAAVGVDS